MRLAIKIVGLLFVLFQSSIIGAQEQERYYVASENIVLSQEGILILGQESLLLAKHLFHDEHGFYFTDMDSGWICNWCGSINPLDAITCDVCGESYNSRPPKKR